MAKDAYTKVEAHKKLLELFKKAGIDPNEAGDDIKKILAAKGGPKGADVDPGMIYVLPADQSKSKVPEIFITYCRRQWGTENYFNAAICSTATARSPEHEMIEAGKATGAGNIRSAYLGEPLMTLDELNKSIIREYQTRLANKKGAPRENNQPKK